MTVSCLGILPEFKGQDEQSSQHPAQALIRALGMTESNAHMFKSKAVQKVGQGLALCCREVKRLEGERIVQEAIEARQAAQDEVGMPAFYSQLPTVMTQHSKLCTMAEQCFGVHVKLLVQSCAMFDRDESFAPVFLMYA